MRPNTSSIASSLHFTLPRYTQLHLDSFDALARSMPPKTTRGKRGGDPYRKSQRLRREGGLTAQEVGDRRPPEPEGPPPDRSRSPAEERPTRVVTESVVLVPRRRAVSEPPTPIAPPPTPGLPIPSGQGWAPGIPLDPTAVGGWQPGWVFVGAGTVPANPPAPPPPPPLEPKVTETSQRRVVKKISKKSPRKAAPEDPPLFAPKGDSSGSRGPARRERSRSPLKRRPKSPKAKAAPEPEEEFITVTVPVEEPKSTPKKHKTRSVPKKPVGAAAEKGVPSVAKPRPSAKAAATVKDSSTVKEPSKAAAKDSSTSAAKDTSRAVVKDSSRASRSSKSAPLVGSAGTSVALRASSAKAAPTVPIWPSLGFILTIFFKLELVKKEPTSFETQFVFRIISVFSTVWHRFITVFVDCDTSDRHCLVLRIQLQLVLTRLARYFHAHSAI